MRVLEDNGLIHFAQIIGKEDYKFRIMLCWRAFYDYHGISFFRAVSHSNFKVVLNINFGRMRFLVLSAAKLIVFSITPYNYSKGRLFFLDYQGFLTGIRIKTLNSYYQRVLGIPGFQEKFEQEAQIMEHKHDERLGAVSQMNCWKRLALYEALNKLFFTQVNLLPTIDESVKNEFPFYRI